VSELFPAILTQRRYNRGFESVAVTPDGGTAYVATQSPLGSTSSGSPYRDSRVLRVFRLDVRDPLNVKVTGQFVLLVLIFANTLKAAGGTQGAKLRLSETPNTKRLATKRHRMHKGKMTLRRQRLSPNR